MGSSIASNEITALKSVFHVSDGPYMNLPATTFLIGFVLGPLVFAPLSEQYGRRPILIFTLCLYIIFSMACALAPNWVAFLIFRFLSGTFASPPMSVTGGSIADVFEDKVIRGKANVWWSTGTLLGPLAGPVVSGYTYSYSWQWGFWACMMLSGLSMAALLMQPETLATKILRDRASNLNREQDSVIYVAPADLNRPGILTTLVSTLATSTMSDTTLSPWTQKITTTRPIYLLCTEMLVALTCLYMAFVYAVFYMLLEIFPEIFEGIYEFTAGESGLAFVMMFSGSIITVILAHIYDRHAPNIIQRHPHKQAEYLRLPLACVGGPLFVISLFWLGWTSQRSIPWIVPLLSMIPYGAAYQLIFMAMINCE